MMDFEVVKRVCVDYVMEGFRTLTQLPRPEGDKQPLRFVYASGAKAERDQTKKPMILGDYTLMRVCIPSYMKRPLPLWRSADMRNRAGSKRCS